MVVGPATAASIPVYTQTGSAGLLDFLKRSVDYRRIRKKVWYVPIVCVMPAATLSTYALMRLSGAESWSPPLGVLASVGMFAAFFGAALVEELG
jgi:hypothetical protein